MEMIARGSKRPGLELSPDPRNPKRRRVELDVCLDESGFKRDCSTLYLHDVANGTESPAHPQIICISNDDKDGSGGGNAARPEGNKDFKLFGVVLRVEDTMEKPRSQPQVDRTKPPDHLETICNGECGRKTGNQYYEPLFTLLKTKDQTEESRSSLRFQSKEPESFVEIDFMGLKPQPFLEFDFLRRFQSEEQEPIVEINFLGLKPEPQPLGEIDFLGLKRKPFAEFDFLGLKPDPLSVLCPTCYVPSRRFHDYYGLAEVGVMKLDSRLVFPTDIDPNVAATPAASTYSSNKNTVHREEVVRTIPVGMETSESRMPKIEPWGMEGQGDNFSHMRQYDRLVC
ncbi:hypothetical protein CRG98_026702 [Punica granatum]|uniref:Uncharacterized protein n=1 Tax=Punica granatum TaxID=22663 RepID=A0A2I0J9D7_PUNGR|nr:hypothetical protein CRG98_026702 [Punica granatum]